MRTVLYLLPYMGIPAILEDVSDGTLGRKASWILTLLQCVYIAAGVGVVGVLILRGGLA